MDVEAVQVFTSLLAMVAFVGAVLLVLARLLSGRWQLAAEAGAAVAAGGLWLAFVVATGATIGSLYFSESAGYVPCQLCWYQRIAMYPLVPLTFIAAIRRDRLVAWYVVPIASIGAGIAGYHYLIEWRPALEGGACAAFGPSCTDIWFRQFGVSTLAFMALAGFLAIIAFALLPPESFARRSAGRDRDLPPRTEST